jgi:hypothetical protein
MPTLNDLVNAVPFVSRGDVIAPESFNAIRAALLAIATQIGGAVSGSQTVVKTFTPTFLPSVTDVPWVLSSGFARNPPGGMAGGWFPIDLPDGSRLQRMTVVAGRTGPLEAPAQMDIMLQRQSVRGSSFSPTLATVSLVGASLAAPLIEQSGIFGAPTLSPAEQGAAQVVDNSEYKYFIRADMLGLPPGSSVFIYAVRVECRL